MNPEAQPQGECGGEPIARGVPGAARANGPVDAGATRASDATGTRPALPAGPANAGRYVIDDALDDVPNATPLPARAIAIHGLSSDAVRELLEHAQKYLLDDAKARRARKNTPPSTGTMRQYRRKVRKLAETYRKNRNLTGNWALDLLVFYAESEQTYKVMRAALKWHLLRRIQFRVAELRNAARENVILPMHSCLSLRSTLSLVQEVDSLSFKEISDFLQHTPRRPGANRMTLCSLETKERKRFLKMAEKSPTYRLADTVLNFCGMRPIELQHGVTIEWLDDAIEVKILGGKVREGVAGQPWRMMRLNAAMVPAWFADHVRSERSFKVFAEPDAMRKHLERLGPMVLNPRRGETNLTAYAFRHALVTDLRDAGWTTEEIAMVLGELSAATVATYGRRRGRGKVRPVAIERSSVRSALEVKPLDRSGLAALLESRASTKAKTTRR